MVRTITLIVLLSHSLAAVWCVTLHLFYTDGKDNYSGDSSKVQLRQPAERAAARSFRACSAPCVTCVRRGPFVARGVLSNQFLVGSFQTFFSSGLLCFVRDRPPSPWWGPPQRYTRYNTSYISYQVLCTKKVEHWLGRLLRQPHARSMCMITPHTYWITPRAST